MPCSSASSSWGSAVPAEAEECLEGMGSRRGSMEGFSFSLPLRFDLPLALGWLGALPLEWAFLLGMGSSISSCFGRFVRPFGLVFGWTGRADESFVLGAGSGAGESGDFDVLVEAEGAERRPERRVSRGERGGPIITACAMVKNKVVFLPLHLFRAGTHIPIPSRLRRPRRPRRRPHRPRPLSMPRTVSHSTRSRRDQARMLPRRRSQSPSRNRPRCFRHDTFHARRTRRRGPSRRQRSPPGPPSPYIACTYLTSRDHRITRG